MISYTGLSLMQIVAGKHIVLDVCGFAATSVRDVFEELYTGPIRFAEGKKANLLVHSTGP